MIVYRIARSHYQELDGEGARRTGGRWNSPGVSAVYASGSRALAALEYLVHVDVEETPDDLVLLSIDIPDDLPVERVEDQALRSGWERAVGDTWVKSGSTPVLCVPSAPVPEEHNYLLNPHHPAAGVMRAVHTRPFTFDERLLP